MWAKAKGKGGMYIGRAAGVAKRMFELTGGRLQRLLRRRNVCAYETQDLLPELAIRHFTYLHQYSE